MEVILFERFQSYHNDDSTKGKTFLETMKEQQCMSDQVHNFGGNINNDISERDSRRDAK